MMPFITTSLRLIDRQVHHQTIQEIYEGPDGRRVRFFASPTIAFSQVWSGIEWKRVHSLLDVSGSPAETIARLFPTTEDILGWCPREIDR